MNRLFLLLFGMVTFVAHAQVPDYVPTEGLVAWYQLDGHALDSGPIALDGVLNGTSNVPNRFNEVESALSLDGADDWVDFGYNDAWHLEDFTLNIWYSTLEWPQLTDYDAIVAAGDAYFMFVGDAGPGGGGNSSFYVSTSPMQGGVWSYENNSDGQWHMMTGMRNASAESIELYIDGVNVGSAAASGGMLVGEQPLSIGRFWDFNPHWFDGRVDDFGIWNRALTEEEILALYNAPAPAPGCTDPTACNYNDEANEDDGTCTYPPFGLADCEAGGALCGEGTIWDASLQACVGFNDCPSDLDGDGIVGVEDLLSLLSDFGTDCVASDDPETAEWTCGDPVSYHGYDYTTVQIGEQCWFAENLRTEQYANGEEIGESTSVFANDTSNLVTFGRLYQWNDDSDAAGLCPTYWHVPNASEWDVMADFVDSISEDGVGLLLKSTQYWESGAGTDLVGFDGRPGGFHYNPIHPYHGEFAHLGGDGYWWTATPVGNGKYVAKHLVWNSDFLLHQEYFPSNGLSVRCLKN